MTDLSDSGGSELDWSQSGKTAGRTWAPITREEKSWENKHDNQKHHQSLKLKTRETQNNLRLELSTINMNKYVLILLKISLKLFIKHDKTLLHASTCENSGVMILMHLSVAPLTTNSRGALLH